MKIRQLSKNKVVRILALILAVVLLLGAAGAGYYFAAMHPYRGTTSDFDKSLKLDNVLTREQAAEDLRYIYKRLESRHPIWLEDGSALPEQVKKLYEAELAAMGDNVTVLQLWQAASRMMALLHDGHSTPNWINPEESLYLDDFTFLQQYGRPSAINGVSTDVVMETYKKSTSYELDFYAEMQFDNNILGSESGLRFCGVDTSAGVDMTFRIGQEDVTKHFGFVPVDQIKGYTAPAQDGKWVSYTIDKERNLGVFTLLTCRNDKEYRQTLDQFFSEVFAGGITNIAVDLRGNGGGNSSVANEFLRYIDVDAYQSWKALVRFGWCLQERPAETIQNNKRSPAFQGALYVLTNARTYSSAMDFAMLVSDNHLGTLVGGTVGNLPDSYGDVLRFQTPNAKLSFTVSYKKWYRIDQSKAGQPLTPDYEVPAQQALDKVYELIGGQG